MQSKDDRRKEEAITRYCEQELDELENEKRDKTLNERASRFLRRYLIFEHFAVVSRILNDYVFFVKDD